MPQETCTPIGQKKKKRIEQSDPKEHKSEEMMKNRN